MKKLLNTLYVTTPDAYLSLDGENVVVLKDNEKLLRIPLHNLESVVTFGYTGVSPALMGSCVKRKIALSFCSNSGRFLAMVTGEYNGSVLLRRAQHRAADNQDISLGIARNILVGKLHNSKWVLERGIRDYPQRVEVERLKKVGIFLTNSIKKLRNDNSYGSLIGIEGEAATQYFSVINELILQNKTDFVFSKRTRRPPLDRINALLSFVYMLLAHETAGALAAIGLDPYVGFLHKDRPGRQSLALDIMEELRAPLADRFAITMINTRQINGNDFISRENGAVYLKDESRKIIINAWQEKKKEQIIHPFIKEKVEWGLVPHIQSLLLARYLRGDLEAYPPFLWK